MPLDNLPARKSFSQILPTLQLAWDSTSMGTFKVCPRKYYYSILLGLVPRYESVHLTFGIHYHVALETYDKARIMGASHVQALRAAMRRALVDTWDPIRSRPWASDDKYKNRLTLLRTIVWYLDQFSSDVLETVTLADGRAAVELSFRMDLSLGSVATGEPYLLCGHLDRLVTFQNHTWVLDHKTTKSPLNDEDFFDRYSPDNQVSTYSYASKVVFSVPAYGVIMDVAQVLITGSDYMRGQVIRNPLQLDEWRSDLDWWLALAEHCAKTERWPQNDAACGLYGGCAYRQICGKSPGVRADWLKASYVQRVWDPLVTRDV